MVQKTEPNKAAEAKAAAAAETKTAEEATQAKIAEQNPEPPVGSTEPQSQTEAATQVTENGLAFVVLEAPPGTDKVSHGTETYRVDNDGTVTVPPEAAASLLEKGGFTAVPLPKTDDEKAADAAQNDGKIKMRHVSGGGSASFDGEHFEADKNGNIRVPARAIGELASHGFVVVT